MNTESRVPEVSYRLTWRVSLRWLTLKTGKHSHRVELNRLRSHTLALATEELLRPELLTLIKGPTRATARDFAATVGRLSLHCWRAEVTPEQATLIAADFQRDLADATADELELACEQIRRRPGKTYPSPGDLLELLRDVLRERTLTRIGAQLALQALDYVAPPEPPVATVERMHEIKRRLLGIKLTSTSKEPDSPPLSTRQSTARRHTDAAELLQALQKRPANGGPSVR